ncbi:hypothetical protein [Thermococcus aciditolerans]|uniref:Uncharacterized protein n=1 Tax=Thermococcus aciditolerans TaxID=2598455 RepID=A0A5C0SIU0_9EURY|nr:hypothetical protein [Thermococcus aciditolerans]QEK14170.1 hypothetical protein FPV09_02505 [Thermococcus aciditolerans]
MNLDYFSTLAGVSTTVISIIMVFYASYIIYLRQQRDKYREMLIREFQELDKLIHKWSLLEEYSLLEWAGPRIGKYLQILSQENWHKSVIEEVLRPYLKQIQKEFKSAQEQEMKLRSQTERILVAGPAMYLKVKFALRDLFEAIYREFPQPPGEFDVSDGIPVKVRLFMKYNFPQNREEFQKWKKRFDIFFQDIHKVYYQLRPILHHLVDIHNESIKQTLDTIKEIQKYGVPWAEEGLKKAIELEKDEMKYYNEFLELLLQIKYKNDVIADKIAKYDAYTYKRGSLTVLCFVGMAVTGIILPLFALFYEPSWMRLLGIISGMGFGLTSLFAVLLIYREITAT